MNESADPNPGKNPIQIAGNSAAPFVYFDLAPAYAVEGGTVVIELVAATFLPETADRSRPEIVATGHLRTNIRGMRSLRAAIDALELAITPAANPEGPKN